MTINKAVIADVVRSLDRLENKHGEVSWTVVSRLLTQRRNRNKLHREIATARDQLAELERRK